MGDYSADAARRDFRIAVNGLAAGADDMHFMVLTAALVRDADAGDVALTEDDYSCARSLCEQHLRSKMPGARFGALIGLSSLGPRASTSAGFILDALRDREPSVRVAAVHATASAVLESETAKAALEQARMDPSTEVRDTATKELSRLPSLACGRTLVRRAVRLAHVAGTLARDASATGISCLTCEIAMLDVALLDFFVWLLADPSRRDVLMKETARAVLEGLRRPPAEYLDGVYMISRAVSVFNDRAREYGLLLRGRKEMDRVCQLVHFDGEDLLRAVRDSCDNTLCRATRPGEARELFSVVPAQLLMERFLAHVEEEAVRAAVSRALHESDPVASAFAGGYGLAARLLGAG